MVHTITVTATFDSESKADAFVDAIQDLDEKNMFPEGAAVQRNIDYTPEATEYREYTAEQHDAHHMDDDAQTDCGDCAEDARFDKIERHEEALYGDYQERYH